MDDLQAGPAEGEGKLENGCRIGQPTGLHQCLSFPFGFQGDSESAENVPPIIAGGSKVRAVRSSDRAEWPDPRSCGPPLSLHPLKRLGAFVNCISQKKACSSALKTNSAPQSVHFRIRSENSMAGPLPDTKPPACSCMSMSPGPRRSLEEDD